MASSSMNLNFKYEFKIHSKGKAINSSIKTIVMNVYHKMVELHPDQSLNDLKSTVANLTGVSVSSIDRMLKEFSEKGVFSTPGKTRPKKRQKIDSKKLPNDILENLKDDPVPEKQDCIENDSGSEVEDGTIKDICAEEEIVDIHGPTTFRCKVLPVESKKPKYISGKVANFKHNLLFGGRIQRESAREAVCKRKIQRSRVKFT